MEDNGPSQNQCVDPKLKATVDISAVGVHVCNSIPIINQKDQTIQTEITKTFNKTKQNCTINWPTTGKIAINEYDQSNKIFCMGFPWLFPGGVGDFNDMKKNGSSVAEWGKRLLFYEDGRFASDDIFCFFVLNYITRRRNDSSGKFFVDDFYKNCPTNLKDLQEKIENGDTSYANRITYYSQRVKGTSSYWRSKRSELYSWINFHVEQGNGAPMFFITLSCAEYYWKDIMEILQDRFQKMGKSSEHVGVGKPGLVQTINEYTVVIQEYFQQRVEKFLDTVGKDILGIQHYWIRYEFTPGRGQIHAHLLAISTEQKIFSDIHNSVPPMDDSTKAKVLANWSEKQFGLTATVPGDFEEYETKYPENPVSKQFGDNATNMEMEIDKYRLLKQVQTHICSGFCMRLSRSR